MLACLRRWGWTTLVGWILSAGVVAGEEVPFAVGDRVVTVKAADIKKGDETLLSTQPGTELEVTAVQGDFLGVTLSRPDADPLQGWIYAPNVKRVEPDASAADPASAEAVETSEQQPAMQPTPVEEPAAEAPAAGEPSGDEPATEPAGEPTMPDPAPAPAAEKDEESAAEPAADPPMIEDPFANSAPPAAMPSPLPSALPGLELPKIDAMELDTLMVPTTDELAIEEPSTAEPPAWTKLVLQGEPIPPAVWDELAAQFDQLSQSGQLGNGSASGEPLKGLNLQSEALASAGITPQALESALGPPDEVRPPAVGREGATYYAYGPLFLGVSPGEEHFSQVKAGGLLWQKGFRAMAEQAAADEAKFSQAKQAYDALLAGIKAVGEDAETAVAQFDQAVELAPDDAHAFRWRALALAQQGEWDRAWADLEKALELGPESPGLHSDRGVVLEVRGDREQALAEYDKALQLDPAFVAALRNRAALHAAAGDHDRALADLATAIEAAPEDPANYRARAELFKSAGDLGAAAKDTVQAKELEAK